MTCSTLPPLRHGTAWVLRVRLRITIFDVQPETFWCQVHKNFDIAKAMINHPQFYHLYGCYKPSIQMVYHCHVREMAPQCRTASSGFSAGKSISLNPKASGFRVEIPEEIWTFEFWGFIFNCHIASVPTEEAAYWLRLRGCLELCSPVVSLCFNTCHLGDMLLESVWQSKVGSF